MRMNNVYYGQQDLLWIKIFQLKKNFFKLLNQLLQYNAKFGKK